MNSITALRTTKFNLYLISVQVEKALIHFHATQLPTSDTIFNTFSIDSLNALFGIKNILIPIKTENVICRHRSQSDIAWFVLEGLCVKMHGFLRTTQFLGTVSPLNPADYSKFVIIIVSHASFSSLPFILLT